MEVYASWKLDSVLEETGKWKALNYSKILFQFKTNNSSLYADIVCDSWLSKQADRLYCCFLACCSCCCPQLGWSEQGRKDETRSFKVKWSLYGLRQSPKNFFQNLKRKLELIDFRSAWDMNSCLFISEDVICLAYVDDTFSFLPAIK